jgi:hypothetical protein
VQVVADHRVGHGLPETTLLPTASRAERITTEGLLAYALDQRQHGLLCELDCSEKVDKLLTCRTCLDPEPSISASGAAITAVAEAARKMSSSFMVSNLRYLEDKLCRTDSE